MIKCGIDLDLHFVFDKLHVFFMAVFPTSVNYFCCIVLFPNLVNLYLLFYIKIVL